MAAAGRGPHGGPGISVELSALHPRYARAQQAQVTTGLLPCLIELARLAHGYGIGLNIDAEEADRIEPSLDLLEALCHDPVLAGWDGIGFVVQAYQKRAVRAGLADRLGAAWPTCRPRRSTTPAELSAGDPALLATGIGPVISAAARDASPGMSGPCGRAATPCTRAMRRPAPGSSWRPPSSRSTRCPC